jgi:hypothetical protein
MHWPRESRQGRLFPEWGRVGDHLAPTGGSAPAIDAASSVSSVLLLVFFFAIFYPSNGEQGPGVAICCTS